MGIPGVFATTFQVVLNVGKNTSRNHAINQRTLHPIVLYVQVSTPQTIKVWATYKKIIKNKLKTSPKAPPTVIPDAQAKPQARSYNSTIEIVTTVLSQFITNLNSVIGPLISLLTDVLQKRFTP